MLFSDIVYLLSPFSVQLSCFPVLLKFKVSSPQFRVWLHLFYLEMVMQI
ncbi:hypothetical protein SLEP1_g35015 [Rubroshorea leprosula]|uniref:Uncharacterized protein n=1 Tax=Rubroshorea leprosula TaxID=152421 RepID=A0AAV5KLY2_9ROSI|nr:hypothetical protein SLEP1_g35015 [Rubroshorea leprosula]